MSYEKFLEKWKDKTKYICVGPWPNRIAGITLDDEDLQKELNKDWSALSYEDRIKFIKYKND